MDITNLPLDVLIEVFNCYEETPEQPLETLLLVCRLWRETAMERKRIWSIFNLDFKDGPAAFRCSRQVPRRLARSGSNSPISFTLRLRYGYENCGRRECRLVEFAYPNVCECHHAIQQNVETTLMELMGPDGSLCARWQDIEIIGDRSPVLKLAKFFSYPTPRLISLTLIKVQYKPETSIFLPSTPSLRSIKIDGCGLVKLPDFTNVIRLHFTNRYFRYRPWNMEPVDSIQAHQVQWLELDVTEYIWRPFSIPSHLPFLEHLSLAGDVIPANISDVHMPSLKQLSIRFKKHDDDDGIIYNDSYRLDRKPILYLVQCQGIPFDQIETLSIKFGEYYPITLHEEHWKAYATLLRLCCNVKTLYGDHRSTIFILKLLNDDCVGEGALTNRRVVISNGKENKVIRSSREERQEDIESFAAELGLPQMKEDHKEFLKEVYELYKNVDWNI